MKYNLLGAVSTIALGAAFGMGTPGAANAALSCTGTVSGFCTTTGLAFITSTDFASTSITLDKFVGPGVGNILTGVGITMSGITNYSGTLTNDGSASATGKYFFSQNEYTFSAGSGAPSNFLSSPQSFSGFIGSSNVTLPAGGSAAVTVNGPAVGGGPINVSPLAAYIGPGTFDALVTAHTTGGAQSSPAGFTANGTLQETGVVTVTYTFSTPETRTPEPASLALLGVGLAGLGAIRRRRKA